MLTVDQAIEAILGRCSPLPARPTPLLDALGLILDEAILADIDLPPFDKSLVDGYAVCSTDLPESKEYRLEVVEEIAAGQVPAHPLRSGESSRIMTGAPLPSGADAVVMVEKSRLEGSTVCLSGPIAPGLSRLTRAREMKAGEVLLNPGHRIDPTSLGLIASAGRIEVSAIPRPTVSILPTGDELVPLDQLPRAGQIRNTNGPMLVGLARTWGCSVVREMPIAQDDRDRLRDSLAKALEGTDFLLVSGGVSAGTKDLVPSTLIELGIEPVFHKVNVKPGKPLWFGVGPSRGSRPGILVFGLPGNPVSGVVSFLLFVRPALEALSGHLPKRTQLASIPLGRSFAHRGDRPTYHPSRLENGQLIPLDWGGSADLRTVALADGFAAFPAGDRTFELGEPIAFLPK
jgi:molybdopterin molybdotransferase